MANVEAAIAIFSFIFIIINAAIYHLKRDYFVICIIFSIFCLSMVGSAVSQLTSGTSGPIFDGLMMISGVGSVLAVLFKLLGVIESVHKIMQNHQI